MTTPSASVVDLSSLTWAVQAVSCSTVASCWTCSDLLHRITAGRSMRYPQETHSSDITLIRVLHERRALCSYSSASPLKNRLLGGRHWNPATGTVATDQTRGQGSDSDTSAKILAYPHARFCTSPGKALIWVETYMQFALPPVIETADWLCPCTSLVRGIKRAIYIQLLSYRRTSIGSAPPADFLSLSITVLPNFSSFTASTRITSTPASSSSRKPPNSRRA